MKEDRVSKEQTMNNRQDSTQIRLRAIRGDVARLGNKIDGLTQSVGSLEHHVGLVHDDMAEIQMHLDKSKSCPPEPGK